MTSTTQPLPAEGASQTGATTERPPRLMIKKMVLENFKSYAGVREIGPFHQSFTSIVGPNGSGKSNVIDALLFVFGKRAKQIRLNKVSELIHNSENHQDLDFAKVSVHFHQIIDLDNNRLESSFRSVPNSDFVITRVARRDNSSKYYINDKASTFTEVTTLLKDLAVDIDNNRFLILQGEVEQISLMKPKAPSAHEDGLLEYLEDIIGTNKYIERIEALALEVEALNEQRNERLHRLKIAEREKKGLEGSKNEAVKFIKLEMTLNKKRAHLYKLYCDEMEGTLQNLKMEKENSGIALEQERAKSSANSVALHALEADYVRISGEHAQIVRELAECKEKFTSFERKDVECREALKHKKGCEKKIATSLAKDAATVKKCQEDVSTSEEGICREEAHILQFKSDLLKEEVALESVYCSLKSETEPIRCELEAKETDLAPYVKRIDSIQAEIDVAQVEMIAIQKAIEQPKNDFIAFKKQLSEIRNEINDKENAVCSSKDDIKAFRKNLETIVEEKVVLSNEEARLVASVKWMKARLEDSKVAQHEEKSKNTVNDAIMKASRGGVLKGVHGRLGDLGSIDDRYDVAISTACSSLNHIVVDNTDVAQNCVEFLKKNGLGRATFIMMDKMTTEIPSMAAPEGALRLYDLIQPIDKKYAGSFYFAIRDTLVCPTLDDATRIAYQGKTRHRVVTLAGQLIDASGTMSGGGNKVARGGMTSSSARVTSQSSVVEDFQALEKEITQLSNKISDIRNTIKKMEVEEATLKKSISNLDITVQKYEMDIPTLRARLVDLEPRVEQLQKKVESAQGGFAVEEQRIEELKRAITDAQGLKKSSEDLAAGLRSQVRKLKDRLSSVGGDKLSNQIHKVETLKTNIDASETMVTKLRVQLKSASKNLEKAAASVAAGEGELVTLRDEIETTKAELVTLEDEAFKVMEDYKAVQARMNEKNGQLSLKEEEKRNLSESLGSFISIEMDLLNKIENCVSQIADIKKKLQQMHVKRSNALTFKSEVEMTDEELVGQEGDTNEDEDDDVDRVLSSISTLETSLRNMKPNLTAIAEYRIKDAGYRERAAQLEAVSAQRDAVRRDYEALRKARLDEFLAGFSTISSKLKEMYQMLTMGGDAELELVDSLDPFSEGIVLSVRPPKKSWKNITNLSGGEKTLSSLALVFALHHFKPTPLYVMDEIDAALDFRNVSIVANYIKERTDNAQFIVISLRNNMFELADRLVGIYKTDNCTKSVTINPAAFVVPPLGGENVKPATNNVAVQHSALQT